jgi:adhesin transport system membrane fusion protein
MPTLEQRVTECVVYAPVKGTINLVFFASIGAVVSEGEIIAEIVPSTADLRIEALVSPSDIANIEPDQKVRISLTAFEAAKYGTIPGRVIRVSADASVQDSSQNRMFTVDCSIEGSLTLEDGSHVTIKPGMVAQVDIVRGRRSVLEYFWNPVVKMKDRAFRE